jgi:hypothetical protein
MKKLNLDLGTLRVESFETFVSERHARGTVRANAGCVTYSCGGTCGAYLSQAEKDGDFAATPLCSQNCCA